MIKTKTRNGWKGITALEGEHEESRVILGQQNVFYLFMVLLDYFLLAAAEGPIAAHSPPSVEGSQALLFEDDERAKQF